MFRENSLLKPFLQNQRVGLVTDMDGTLSPIVREPTAARVTPRNLELLKELNNHLTLVAVVSGRGAADLQQRVGLPELSYTGNHGLEHWENDAVQVTPEAVPFRQALDTVRERLELMPGMALEDKGVTFSIHYRQASDPEAIKEKYEPLLQQLADELNLKLFPGRMIFELRPPLDIHKGTAFKHLVTTHQLDAALYLGDDTTDADAMQMAQQMREQGQAHTVAVGVTSDDMPAVVQESADLLVQGVEGVEAFLDDWLNALIESST